MVKIIGWICLVNTIGFSLVFHNPSPELPDIGEEVGGAGIEFILDFYGE